MEENEPTKDVASPPKQPVRVAPLPTTIDGKLERAILHKSEGNEMFKASNYKKAISLYSKGLSYTTGLDGRKTSLGEADIVKKMGYTGSSTETITPEQDAYANEIEKMLHQNIAACHLKLDTPREAIKHCDKALKLDPKLWKSLLRKGEAYVKLSYPDEAKEALEAAKALCEDAGDAGGIENINRELKKVDQLVKAYEKKQRKMAARMFGGGEDVGGDCSSAVSGGGRAQHNDKSSTSSAPSSSGAR